MRKASRSRISFRMRTAISFCFGGELGGQLLEPGDGRADRHLGDLADMVAVDLHRERLRLQPIAGAGLARLLGLIARQLFRHPGRVGLAPAPLDIVDHAFERLLRPVFAHAVVIDEIDLVLARAVQDHIAEILRQILPRRRHLLLVGACQSFQRLLIIGRGGGGPRPGRDGAAREHKFSSGTISSGSKNSSVPSPSHSGHAP